MQNKNQNIYQQLVGPETPMGMLRERSEHLAGPIGSRVFELQERAETDYLTGLKNRFGIENHLNRMLATQTDNLDRYIVMFMDLDGFKPVNDTQGHPKGDEILKAISKRLQLRKTDVVGRFGGDEFLVIVDTENEAPDRRGKDRPDNAPRRQKRTRDEIITGLTEHLRQQVEQGGHDVGCDGISASIGVVELNGYRTSQEVVSAADKLMYENKQQRKHE